MKEETEKNFGIYINGIKYFYSISKSDKEKLIIKLYDATNKINIYYSYSGDIAKLKRDIRFLDFCENLNDIISCLNDIFNKGNAQVDKIEGKYYLQLKYIESGINISSTIQLFKHDNKNEDNNEIEDRINKIENDYKELYNKYEELKIKKEEDIKNIIKETIFDNDVQKKLFENMENMLIAKYNLNNIPKKQYQNYNIENNIMNKVNEVVKNKENEINKQIDIIQKQLKENMNYINNINLNNHNYIILQVKIDEKDLNKDIRLFNQVRTYKYYCNFERDDIEVIIDNQLVNIKYKYWKGDFKYDEKLKNCELSQKIEYNLNIEYEYYWNFTITGIHTIKVIFKKKLLQCNGLFSNCDNIYKVDCSNFDCSQIIDCSRMFGCCSSLIEINLGKLDFALSSNFSKMFHGCINLEKLDVSYLNPNNSKSFRYMFSGCSKLKEINVSKFKETNCKDINYMFSYYSSTESIDILNQINNNINQNQNINNQNNMNYNFKNQNQKILVDKIIDF